MKLSPLTPGFGSEVFDVDLADLAVADVAAIKQAFVERKVLVFRDQDLSRDDHKRFGQLFGELHVHPGHRTFDRDGDPEIFVVHTTEASANSNGEGWHSDVSCETIPPLGSALYVKQLPGDSGGDTLFADMARAFDELSEPIKALLRPLSALHDGRKDLARYGVWLKPHQHYPKAVHPIVPRHPESGAEVLFVNPSFTESIEGLPRAESDALLEMLCQSVINNPRLHCRVRWQPGSLTLWDNRCTWHHAIWDYFPNERYAERVSVLAHAPPSR